MAYSERERARKRNPRIFLIRGNLVFRGHRAIGRIIEHDGWFFEARGRNDGPIGIFPTYRRAATEVVDAVVRTRGRR
jgi:hypothetical protein